MGNKIARTTQASATEYYLHDLPSSYNLVLKEVLGRGRFLKSILCKHDEGLVLVKVYFKRGDSIDLSEYERRLSQIHDIFSSLDHPHVWPFQFWLETDKAAYLLRQYFFKNLHDRLSTRPFLSIIEKKWLAFQLLFAVKQIHERGVCHGDIKCENVLVTSWNWLYLADFASFKPTYIPHNDPSDFSFFFDTGGRRRCYLAPERFYEHGGEMQVAQDAPLQPSMDIFALGCVIAELFLEGQPLFELSQLLAYRRGQCDPSQHLEKIPDLGIRRMILHMIQLDPKSRFSAETYLQSLSGVVFPSYFSPFLHDFYFLLNPLNSDARVLLCQTSFQEVLKQMMGDKGGSYTGSDLSVPSDAVNGPLQEMDEKQELDLAKEAPSKIEEPEKVSTHDRFDLLGEVNNLLSDVKQNSGYSETKPTFNDVSISANSKNKKQCDELIQSISNVFKRSRDSFLKKMTMNNLNSRILDNENQSDKFGMPYLPTPHDNMSCEGMVLIASLLCSCVRNVKLPFTRRASILLLKSCSLYIDDEDRLQRVLPYVIAMLSDPAAIVRSAALETLCDILLLVRDFPPSDAKIFPEYIIPMLSMLPDDPEESVRICYASNISKLALTAYEFLLHSISLSEAGVLNETLTTKTSRRPHSLNSDALLAQLRKSIADVVKELVMGLKQTPNIRRALLQDIGNLCWFLGERQSNDFLLPILPAFLNDRDNQLRAEFYRQIICVCFFVGQRSVEEYLLPYIEQGLADATEAVIVNTLDCLAILCQNEFLRKRILLEMIERAIPLLCYPSQCVRRSAITFVTASSESLGAIDSYVFLVPLIRPMLCRQPASLASDKALLSCLKPPIPREIYHQVFENSRSYSTSSEDNENKLKAMGSLAKISSSAVDSHDCPAPEICSFSRFIDKSSEGKTFSYVEVDKKRITGVAPKASNYSSPCHMLSYDSSSLEVSGTLKGSSITVADKFTSTEFIEFPSFSQTSKVPDSGWRPRGVLVAHLQEHCSAVNEVSVSMDHSFFVSASEDSSVKVWDTKKLEKDISFRSKVTYSLGGSRALCVAVVQGSSQVVVGASNGTIHTFTLDYISGGLGNIKDNGIGEGAIVSLLDYSPDVGGSKMILYSTQNSGIHLWDTRTNINAWNTKGCPSEGYVSSLVAGPCGNWFVSGSSRGVLTLWDLRFRIPVNSWQYSLACPIETVCRFILSPDTSFSAVTRPLVYVSAGCNEVSLWNAEDGKCYKVLRVANSDQDAQIPDLPWALVEPHKGNTEIDLQRNSNSKYRVDKLKNPPPPLPGIRAMLPLPGGDLLTGGTDLKIRCWDHSRPDRSYCVCGPSIKGVGKDEFYEARSTLGVQVVRGSKRSPSGKTLTKKAFRAAAATDRAGCHRDSILYLASVKLNQRLLISSSRDGAIKVWK